MGGRVPNGMHYDVPGGDIPGLNMDPYTSVIKAEMVLSMAENIGIGRKDLSGFYKKMMAVEFGREFLPMKYNSGTK